MNVETFSFRAIELYRKLRDPKVIEINSTYNIKDAVTLILSHVNKMIDGEVVTK